MVIWILMSKTNSDESAISGKYTPLKKKPKGETSTQYTKPKPIRIDLFQTLLHGLLPQNRHTIRCTPTLPPSTSQMGNGEWEISSLDHMHSGTLFPARQKWGTKEAFLQGCTNAFGRLGNPRLL